MNLLKYSLLRLLLMVLVFCLCFYLLNISIILSIIFAAIIAFAIGYLAFPKLNDAAAADLNKFLGRRPKSQKKSVEAENQEFEDAYVDSNVEVLETEDPASKRA